MLVKLLNVMNDIKDDITAIDSEFTLLAKDTTDLKIHRLRQIKRLRSNNKKSINHEMNRNVKQINRK